MFTIYNQAHNFKKAAERCNVMIALSNGNNGEYEWLPIPYCVNASFACELYLKAILDAEKKERGQKHNLNDLFSLLPSEIKDDVKKKVENVDFDTNLMQAGNMFVDWRYLHEKIEKKEEIFANLDFMRCLLNSLDFVAGTILGKINL